MSKVKKHFDEVSKDYDFYKQKNSFYYSNLKDILRKMIPENSSVLEIGCGTGDLLAFLKPKIGYGMDISTGMVKLAKVKHKNNKNLIFSVSYPRNKKFDYIFMSDVIEHLEKPDDVFKKVAELLSKKGKFINTMANPIWEPALMVAEKLGLKMPEGPHNRISFDELKEIMKKLGLKIIKHNYFLLIPIYLPVITSFINKNFERFFKKYAFTEYIVAKKI